MNDLSYLITKTDVKTEPVERALEKTESNQKSKRTITRKSKLELFKKRLVKQENIENILSSKISMDPSAKSLIDMLDLNVTKIKNCPPVKKRRHSIEKFPLSFESSDSSSFVFSSLPRCRSPKVKRTSKIRQSCEIIPIKRASPYSTRSDSPARILRNGKHRKLKDTLLDGLDSDYKKRRRLCSDYSGSEKSVSKVSGYDSDSSFSDLASLIGNESVDMKDGEILSKIEPKKETTASTAEQDIKPLKILNIKRTMSTETASSDLHQTTDTNSNLFENVKVEPKQLLDKKSVAFFDEDIKSEPSTPDNNSLLFGNIESGVPEKEVILDIMKQTFNDVKVDDEKRTTRSSARKTEKLVDQEEHPCMKTTKFYGISDGSLTEQHYATCKTEKLENVETNIENESQTPETSQTELNEEIENNNKEEEQIQEEKLNVDIDVIIPETVPSLQETAIFPTPIEKGSTPTYELINQVEEIKHAIEEKPDLENSKQDSSENENNNDNFQNNSETILEKEKIVETPENLAIKENILQALGLQSLKAAEEAKQRVKVKTNAKQDYTGTLKTVIKLNRCEKKKNRGTLKMTLQKTKNKGKYMDQVTYGFEDDYTQRNVKEGLGGWRSTSGQTSDTAGAHRKCHYSNRSNIMGNIWFWALFSFSHYFALLLFNNNEHVFV
ncbi:uncharacterized protein MAL13P1.304 [Agrilus planipennis]|uniref:Uncharacterized protein MAL13P1.304 n=1 Tax=Agrilus planipennis TaxID=224129 RepID=A0A1W4XF85_AGRPL|nr:uncharacterized protein MAL13P1.304 [Agrilus planipennis]